MIGPGGRFTRSDAAAVGAGGLIVAGLAIAAGALADAEVPARLHGVDRIVVGLAHVDMIRLLALAVGLGVLTVALLGGARLGGWDETGSRLGAGIAAGGFGLCVAILLAATIVGLHPRFGGVDVTGDSVLGDWLRQAFTAAGFGIAFAVLAVVLAQTEPVSLEEPESEPPPDEAEPATAPAAVIHEPPRILAASLPSAPAPAPPPVHAPIPPLTAQAEQIYSGRLAFSPRAAEARQMVEDVRRFESEGQAAEAVRLIDRLQAM